MPQTGPSKSADRWCPLRAAPLDVDPVNSRAVQKIDLQFPIASDFGSRRKGRCGPLAARLAQQSRNRVADLRGLAGLQLKRVDRNRVFGRRIVVEHDARL